MVRKGGVDMRKFAIAMSEVQSDVVQTNNELVDTLVEAQKVVMDYIRERVGDFLDIDDDDPAVKWQNRNRVVDERLSITTGINTFYEEHYVWRCEGQGGLTVSATIQELWI
jgi:hypothetical protein